MSLAVWAVAGVSCTADIASERIREADLSLRVVQTPGNAGVGSYVSVTGYNLDRVVDVLLGSEVIPADELVAQSPTEIVFLVPAGADYSGISTPAPLRFRYEDESGDLRELEVSPDFAVLRPAVTSAPEQAAGTFAKLGDRLTFEGHNFQLLNRVLAGPVKATIVEQTETQLVIELAEGDYAETIGVAAYTIRGFYGVEPVEELLLAENFRIDNTPVAPTEPVMTSISAADGFYLLKPVVVSGKGMDLVDRIEVGGLEATIVEEESDAGQLTFILPDGFTFNKATDCAVVLFYGERSKTVSRQVIYPFYFWRNVTLGVGSKDNYYQPNSEKAVFCLETGEVISASEFFESDYDPFYKAGKITSRNDISKRPITKDEYQSVRPYIFAVNDGGLCFAGPGNSNTNGLNSHMYLSGASYTSLPANYGTPIIGFTSLQYIGAKDKLLQYADSVRNGTLTCCLGFTETTGSAVPKYKKPSEIKANNSWGPGVMEFAVGYVGYDKGKLSGSSNKDYLKFGFIRVTNITGVDTDPNSENCASFIPNGDGKYEASITFDCYWPKNSK